MADTVLDRTVVPGYSRIGPRLRRRWWPADPAPRSLDGRHVIVTGASSGLGTAAARGIAELGATVHLVGRTLERLEQAAEDIRAGQPDADLVCDVCDVSDLGAVRAYAADLVERVDTLHALVHDAGVMPPERTESPQGHELALATHVLGPLLLSELLRKALRADGDARVIWVSSGGMYTQPFTHEVATDLEYTAEDYSGATAYARTKRMQVIVAEQLAARLEADGICVHSMHPGWADTPGVTDSLPSFAKVMRPLLRSPAEGADTIVWLTASPAGERDDREVLVRPAAPAHRVPALAARDPDRPGTAVGQLHGGDRRADQLTPMTGDPGRDDRRSDVPDPVDSGRLLLMDRLVRRPGDEFLSAHPAPGRHVGAGCRIVGDEVDELTDGRRGEGSAELDDRERTHQPTTVEHHVRRLRRARPVSHRSARSRHRSTRATR